MRTAIYTVVFMLVLGATVLVVQVFPMKVAVLTLSFLHVLAAAVLVGGAFYYYFAVRPSLRAVPPAPASIMAQRIGVGIRNIVWSALALLVVTGALRLYINGLVTMNFVHPVVALVLVDVALYYYFVIRTTPQTVPPPPPSPREQRLQAALNIIVGVVLALVLITGLLRLFLEGQLGSAVGWSFIIGQYGFWVVVMVGLWLLVLINAAVQTFYLMPRLLRKLPVVANPGPADVERRRNLQMSLSLWLERAVLIGLVSAALAAIVGASIKFGGIVGLPWGP